MKGTLRPLDSGEMARIETDARRVTAALTRRMLYEITRTRKLVAAVDEAFSEYNRIAYVDDGDYASTAWDRFSDDLSALTQMTYEWGWAENGTWEQAR